ncbi:hypothetical protein SAMN05660649_00814 [Desulfotomaculum arcticum]|uniref:Na+/glutamate symporter n=2 Tax=Desulfotruncus TaxID=2867377 RepID=A0A1I2PD02_9FIRM|nr:hypothetical protein SAMN05660649_00814 [Desulfotomaculum arcticum] [Desulfotruncus arcticus DSM 17038]
MYEMILSACILFAILVLGDIISLRTKARVPMMFVALITYLILTWVGMPKDFPTVSNLGMFGELMIPLLVIHMSTLVPPHEYIQHWRAVVVALISVTVSVLIIIFAGGLIFGYPSVLSSAGAVSGGGVIAALASMKKLQSIGLGALAVIPLVMVALVDPIGQPIAANMLRKYAKALKQTIKAETIIIEACEQLAAASDVKNVPYGTDENPSIRYKAIIPKEYETEFVMLFKLFALSFIAVILEKYSGINMIFWCLALGIITTHYGILRGKMLERANSLGIAMAALLFYAFTMMNDITPQVLLQEIVTVVAILFIAVIGLILGGFLGGKMVKWPKELGMAVGIGIMFGFPGNLIVSTEVSRSIGETAEEKKYILEQLLPPMLVSGLAGFAIALGITVSILLKTL